MYTNGGKEECKQDIGGKARRKEAIRKTRSRWVDYITMDLKSGMDRTDLAQDMDQWRILVNTVIKLWVP
jgi:hypothetical protein